MSTSLLRNREYVLLWGGQTISAAGSQVSGFVPPLLALQLSGSAAQAGFVGAFGGLPAVVLSLPAGALADRWDREGLMILGDAGRTLNMLSIPVALALGRWPTCPTTRPSATSTIASSPGCDPLL